MEEDQQQQQQQQFNSNNNNNDGDDEQVTAATMSPLPSSPASMISCDDSEEVEMFVDSKQNRRYSVAADSTAAAQPISQDGHDIPINLPISSNPQVMTMSYDSSSVASSSSVPMVPVSVSLTAPLSYKSTMDNAANMNKVPITITLDKVSVILKKDQKSKDGGSSSSSGATSPPQSRKKKLLNSISAVIRPGQLTAILGGSGSGKTTLLNTISGRYDSSQMRVDGDVLFNDIVSPPHSLIKRSVGYVMQKDYLLPNLTVRETLMYNALLRIPSSVSHEDKVKRVEAVISELGLRDCANTRIGGAGKKGVSGGEKRRVSIGCQLLTDPSIVFADEPTSGLDSFTAFQAVNTLQSIARQNRTVICTIHQPRSDIFKLFDQVMLLSKGQLVYIGDIPSMHQHFSKLNFIVPKLENPADYFIDICSIDYRSLALEQQSVDRLRLLIDGYNGSSLHENLLEEIGRHRAEITQQDVEVVKTAKGLKRIFAGGSRNREEDMKLSSQLREELPFYKSVPILTRRSYVNHLRDIEASITRFSQIVSFGSQSLDGNGTVCPISNGEQVLTNYGWEDTNINHSIAIMVALSVAWRIISLLALQFKKTTITMYLILLTLTLFFIQDWSGDPIKNVPLSCLNSKGEAVDLWIHISDPSGGPVTSMYGSGLYMDSSMNDVELVKNKDFFFNLIHVDLEKAEDINANIVKIEWSHELPKGKGNPYYQSEFKEGHVKARLGPSNSPKGPSYQIVKKEIDDPNAKKCDEKWFAYSQHIDRESKVKANGEILLSNMLKNDMVYKTTMENCVKHTQTLGSFNVYSFYARKITNCRDLKTVQKDDAKFAHLLLLVFILKIQKPGVTKFTCTFFDHGIDPWLVVAHQYKKLFYQVSFPSLFGNDFGVAVIEGWNDVFSGSGNGNEEEGEEELLGSDDDPLQEKVKVIRNTHEKLMVSDDGIVLCLGDSNRNDFSIHHAGSIIYYVFTLESYNLARVSKKWFQLVSSLITHLNENDDVWLKSEDVFAKMIKGQQLTEYSIIKQLESVTVGDYDQKKGQLKDIHSPLEHLFIPAHLVDNENSINIEEFFGQCSNIFTSLSLNIENDRTHSTIKIISRDINQYLPLSKTVPISNTLMDHLTPTPIEKITTDIRSGFMEAFRSNNTLTQLKINYCFFHTPTISTNILSQLLFKFKLIANIQLPEDNNYLTITSSFLLIISTNSHPNLKHLKLVFIVDGGRSEEMELEKKICIGSVVND
ncbi:ABC transporter G family protein [Cavenderia fasciculata]|uniref:ABC transporter G family protein n=1 Tax=Cavenderia fasciculata TaxID=261658 RepID=F4Q9G8_CACFS|nr:ABC transporter G family protein [Cavenderia fasciculata]EGG15337.1 ABC transporter G family protein [Cavenderia fasciculata]|eukprot:XP_004352057.1 ABC transporter G family protein [Cavenderia fasciculata]